MLRAKDSWDIDIDVTHDCLVAVICVCVWPLLHLVSGLTDSWHSPEQLSNALRVTVEEMWVMAETHVPHENKTEAIY